MPNTTKKKEVDITKSGPMTYRQLQGANEEMLLGLSPEFQQFSQGIEQTYAPTSLYDAKLHAQQDVMSPLSQQQTFSGDQDYWGRSHWDNPSATEAQFSQLGDIRAENQPWYSKLINGIGKAGVLAGTTALETAGLLYGAGHSLLETTGVLEDNGKSWVQDLWDNPITNALQNITEASEELMPNYYTRDEQENPFGNIFTANFLGDKLLKNLGFMVGAFYGGIPASKLVGAIGKSAVRSARAASLAERAGMAERVGALTAEYGDDIAGLERALAREGLTEAERGKRILEGFDKVRSAAQATRATTQTLGSLGSAINEGAIEALNNSKDWARQQTQVANDEYQKLLSSIEQNYGGTEMETTLKMQAAEDYQTKLAEIEKGRARMGNADLLLNIPILMASNMYQLGKLYTRGFDSTRRQMGSLWNGHALQGSLAKGTLKSGKTAKGAVTSALLKSNTEGLEEYLQRAASDGAGEAVNESIKRFMEAGQGESATNDLDDYIAGFGKAIADNLGDPNAWEEYMIGAVSSMLGMPVFGSQTKNAYMKLGPVGFAGGIYGNYKDYMDAKEHEEQVAQYLNQRVKDPKFKALYDNLKKQDDYDKWLQEQIELGDKSKYKDLELEKFYQDLNAAASSGHLEEFKQMVGYNTEYTDEELEDIVKQTSKKITVEQQKKQDEDRKAYLEGLEGAIASFKEREDSGEALPIEEFDIWQDALNELEEVNKRLEASDYQEKLEGPFIDRNGQMNVTDPDKMREILERNRNNLLQGIDDYLKIRNDIDIETDGKLTDDQIELLTLMRGKILSYDRRSAEMAYDLIDNLGDLQVRQEQWQEKIKQDLQNAQEDYDDAKAHWEAVKNGKHNQEYKNKVEKQFLAAEKKLNKAKAADRSIGNVIKLLQMLTERKETTAHERTAEDKGFGENILERMTVKLNIGQKRNLNSDEVSAILASPQNAITLVSLLNSRTSGLDTGTRERLTQEVVDLSSLANQKMAYNNKIREFMGDPTKINEAYQQAQDKISQEEKDNKSEELSLNIKQANSMVDLDKIMRDAYNVNPEIAKTALNKAKQTADESTKKFIADYEKAVNFYGDVARQAQKLPQEIAAGVMGTAASEWENALQEGVDVYDKFVEGMNAAAEELDKSGVPGGKETASGIRQVLSDLHAAKTSTATNKNTKKPAAKKKGDVEEGESSEQEKSGFAALQAGLNKKRAGKKDGSEQPQTDTKESLQKEVEQEVRNSKEKKGSYKIDDLSKLSKTLRDKIQKYNEGHPDDEFTVDFEELLQRLTDEAISDDNTNLANADLEDDGIALGEDNNGSDRADRMHENVRVTFRSDYPTAFRIFDGQNLLDYRVSYDPDTEQLKAVQRLLHELKAYQFVDKNYLGYVAKAMEDKEEPVTIHLLRSTDETISKDKTNPITFLAIKWDNDAETAIRKYGFGGNKSINLSDEIKPVTINGEQYHIVGVMTLNSQVDAKVSEAFASLQGALNRELNPQIEQARENGQPFVVSQLTTEVDSINTGRLEKRNSEDDDEDKVSLYDFMTSQQGDESRRTSSEWDNGMEFYFGTIVNGFLNIIDDEKIREQMEGPNDTWMDKNNGAVVMYVPKADGKLYPVRVTRRTVGDWLTVTVDSNHTGQQLLAAVLDGSEKNEYLGNIVNYLRTIYDEDATIGDKMTAKMMLQKYFIFGKQSPIHFNGGEVTLQFENREHDLTRDTFEEFATAFFNALADENIKFSLPAHSIESIRGRDVVKSGIFEVGLRGFYNFNANFTIVPIDGEGHQVTVEPAPEGEGHFTGGNNIRATEMQLDLGDGVKTYTIQGDGTVTLNGRPVSTDVQNLVTLVKQAERGTLPQVMTEQLNERKLSPEAKKFVSEGVTGFGGVYIIHAEEDWVYDSRKANHNARLYKLNSDEGTKLKKEINQAISDFVQQHMKEIRELKKPVAEHKDGDVISEVSEKDGVKITKYTKYREAKSGEVKPVSAQGGLKIDGSTILKESLDNAGEYNEIRLAELREDGKGNMAGTVWLKSPDGTWTKTDVRFDRDPRISSPSKEDAEASLRNVGKQMKDTMTTSGDIKEMEALLELGQAAIDQARAAGVGKGIIENIEIIHKGLQAKYNNHKKAVAKEEKRAGGVGAEQQSKMFAGKDITELNAKDGGLEALLAANANVGFVKKVYVALQAAEEAGIPIDQAKISEGITSILEADREEQKQLLNDLLNEINGCNK